MSKSNKALWFKESWESTDFASERVASRLRVDFTDRGTFLSTGFAGGIPAEFVISKPWGDISVAQIRERCWLPYGSMKHMSLHFYQDINRTPQVDFYLRKIKPSNTEALFLLALKAATIEQPAEFNIEVFRALGAGLGPIGEVEQ